MKSPFPMPEWLLALMMPTALSGALWFTAVYLWLGDHYYEELMAPQISWCADEADLLAHLAGAKLETGSAAKYCTCAYGYSDNRFHFSAHIATFGLVDVAANRVDRRVDWDLTLEHCQDEWRTV